MNRGGVRRGNSTGEERRKERGRLRREEKDDERERRLKGRQQEKREDGRGEGGITAEEGVEERCWKK